MQLLSCLNLIHFQIRLHYIFEAHDFNHILGSHTIKMKSGSKNHGIHIIVLLKKHSHIATEKVACSLDHIIWHLYVSRLYSCCKQTLSL